MLAGAEVGSLVRSQSPSWCHCILATPSLRSSRKVPDTREWQPTKRATPSDIQVKFKEGPHIWPQIPGMHFSGLISMHCFQFSCGGGELTQAESEFIHHMTCGTWLRCMLAHCIISNVPTSSKGTRNYGWAQPLLNFNILYSFSIFFFSQARDMNSWSLQSHIHHSARYITTLVKEAEGSTHQHHIFLTPNAYYSKWCFHSLVDQFRG